MLWQLDDWVLCRIYNKKGTIETYNTMDQKAAKLPEFPEHEHEHEHEHETKPEINMYDHNKVQGQQVPAPSNFTNDQLYMDTSDSVPRWHTDSSCSEHVVSPDVTCEREVQSEAKWNEQLGLGLGDAFDFEFNFMDDNLTGDDPFAPPVQYQMNQLSPLQDMFMFHPKPF